MRDPTYSFVIPVWNEEPVLAELHRRLAAVTGGLEGEAEFVFVDDGSTDATRERLLALRETDPRVKVVALSRNFGHQMAITAGLDLARGEAVVIMDADLQDPPEVVPEMVAQWRAGYDVVYATRSERAGEGRLKRWTAHAFYRLLRRASDSDQPIDAGDFRLVDRRVAEIVRNMREPARYLRGMFAWVGFRQTSVSYDRAERYAGAPKYTFSRSLRFAVDAMLGFSTAPLRVALALGFAISLLAFGVGIAAIVFKLFGADTLPGWASLMVLVSFLAGMQLMVLGMVGLYIGRIYEQGKDRPLYLIDEAHGLAQEGESAAIEGSTSGSPRTRNRGTS